MSKATGHKTLPEVEAWLSHHGFALEHETARAFRRAGFTASLGRTYVDPGEHKPREIDVVAEVELTHTPAHIYAVVECKASAIGAWVVRESEMPWNEDLWAPISTDDLTVALHDAAFAVAECLPVGEGMSKPVPFAIVEAVDNGDRDAAYWALSQAVSAARGWLQRAGSPSIALPVVVVDTPLFSLRYDRSGNPHVAPIEMRRVLWPDPGPRSRTAVDVVARPALEKHALDLRFRLNSLADKLLERGLLEVSD